MRVTTGGTDGPAGAVGRWLAAAAMALLLVTAAPGCGDDDDAITRTPGATGAASATAASTGEPTDAAFPDGPPGAVPYLSDMPGVEVETGNPAAPADPDKLVKAVAFPTGDRETSVLLVERTGPADITVGRPYTYEIKVTNLTEAAIGGVRVREQHAGGAFSVEQTTPAVEPAATPPQQPSSPSPSPSADRTPPPLVWNLGTLGPNETRSISVTGVPEQPGRVSTTIAADFAPSLAADAEVKQAEVTVTKEGPATADLCEPFAYKYVVANGGQGDTGTLTLTDQFPSGLVTEDGKGSVSFELGSLPKGQSRDFTVKMKPQQAGEYASRAVAKGAFGEARSRRLATRVTAPKLTVALDGPQWEQITRPIAYRLTVRNDGDAPARDVTVKVDAGGGSVRAVVGQDLAGALAAAQQPPPAPDGEGGQSPPQQNPAQQAHPIGAIEPGQSRTVSVLLKAQQPGNVPLNVSATSSCSPQPVTATAQTLVVGVPALSVDVVDAADPVPAGGELTYRVTVTNVGSAADGGVHVSATLPDGTTFVEGSGQTPVKAEGNRLTFAPVAAMGPNQSAQWQVKLKAEQPGEKRVRVEVRSAGVTGVLSQTEQTHVSEPPPPPPAQAAPDAVGS